MAREKLRGDEEEILQGWANPPPEVARNVTFLLDV